MRYVETFRYIGDDNASQTITSTLKQKGRQSDSPDIHGRRLKTSFNVSCEYQRCQPDDLFVSVHNNASWIQKDVIL